MRWPITALWRSARNSKQDFQRLRPFSHSSLQQMCYSEWLHLLCLFVCVCVYCTPDCMMYLTCWTVKHFQEYFYSWCDPWSQYEIILLCIAFLRKNDIKGIKCSNFNHQELFIPVTMTICNDNSICFSRLVAKTVHFCSFMNIMQNEGTSFWTVFFGKFI